jgi:hypothetical protein
MHRLEAGNVLCLKAFGAFLYFKFHCLAFVERFISVHHDRREVYENIFTGLTLDKTIALRSIEPLNRSLFLHFYYLACASPIWLGCDVEIALFLLVRILVSCGQPNTRLLPSAVTASRPAKKGRKDCPSGPLETSQRVIQEQQTLDKWYYEMGHLSTPQSGTLFLRSWD